MLDAQALKFELHYYFGDNLHQMDAVVRHRCEGELLKILGEISNILHAPLSIQTEAYAEGGLKEIYSVFKKNQFIAGVLTAVVTGVLINVLSEQINSDKELNKLQKENIRLEIELKKKELYEKNKVISEGDKGTIVSIQNDLVFILTNDYRTIRARSEFYKNLLGYNRVTMVSGQQIDANNQPVSEAKIVKREQFRNFILTTDELPKELDENAVIELISPVLKRGKYKWRGLYHGEPIDFYMKDDAFKSSIFNQQVSFKNGISLKCVLEICKKMNEIGDIYVSSYSVTTVISYDESGEKVETKQGSKYFRDKAEVASQLNLFEK